MKNPARAVLWMAALALLAAPAVAQEKPAEPAAPPQENAPQTESAAQAAPKQGHPLDPADVAVLTGRTRNRNAGYGAYAAPYAVYGAGGSRFAGSSFAPVTTATRPPFTVGAFGRIGGRNFFLIEGTSRLGLPLFFAAGGRATATRVFLTPGMFFFSR